MWDLSVNDNTRHDTVSYYKDDGCHNQRHVLSASRAIGNSQSSIAPLLNSSISESSANQPVFRRVMQRLSAMLAHVGGYFHRGYRQLTSGARDPVHPTMNTMIPLLDEPSLHYAKYIINDFSIPLSSPENKPLTVEELVYFIGLAVIRLAESHASKIADSRAMKNACNIINHHADHPGMGMLRYIERCCKGRKGVAAALVVQAVETGRKVLYHSGYQEYIDSVHALAALWDYFLANAATDGVNLPGTGFVRGHAGCVNLPSV